MPPAEPRPNGGYRPVPARHPGGTLVVADWEAPTTLDPLHAATAADLRVSGLLFAPLWGRDPGLVPYPELVREVPTVDNHDVQVAPDGLSMTVLIKLLPGLRWSDGEPITADDVIFTVGAICAPGQVARDATGFDRITAQERHSPTELLWRFGPRQAGDCNLTSAVGSGVYPAVTQLGPRARILPRHRLAGTSPGDWSAAPFFVHPDATSGPFAFRSRLGGELLDLVANPHFTDGRSRPGGYGAAAIRFDHAPHLDAVTYRFNNSRASLIAGLRAGESELGFHLAPEDEVELSGSPGSQTILATTLQGEFLSPNHGINSETHRAPPWVDDRPVLEALRLALDRHALNSAAFGGRAAVARGLYPAAMSDYQPVTPLPERDLAAARRVLEADGWQSGASGVRSKAGRRLEFTLLAPCGSAPRVSEQQELVKEWSAAGFAVRTDCRPRQRFFASFRDGGVNAGGAFDMSLYSNTWEPDPSSWAPFGVSSSVPSAQNPGGQNWNRCSDPEIDRTFAAGAETLNRRARQELYGAGAAAWLGYGCTIPILDWPAVVQRSVRLHNFIANPSESMQTWNAADWWLDE